MFGLHRHQTYDELVGEINRPLDIRYPDRKASQLRFGMWLSQLDSEGVKSIQQQQLNAMKEQHKQNLLREYAMSTGQSHAEVKAKASQTDQTTGDDGQDLADMHENNFNLFQSPDPQSVARNPFQYASPALLTDPSFAQAFQRDVANMSSDDWRVLQRGNAQQAFHMPTISSTTQDPAVRNLLTPFDQAVEEDIVRRVDERIAQEEIAQAKRAKTAELFRSPQQTEVDEMLNELLREVSQESHKGLKQDIGGTKKFLSMLSAYDDAPVGASVSSITPATTVDDRFKIATEAGWTEIPQQPSVQLWKLALGKKNQHKVITEQMWLRKLEWNARMTVEQMIKAVMKHDEETVVSPKIEPEKKVETKGRRGRPKSQQSASSSSGMQK